MYEAILSGVTGAKAALDTLGTILKMKVSNDVAIAVNHIIGQVATVQTALLESQTQLGQQQDVIRDLKAQVEKLEQWQRDAAGYERIQSPGGAIVWKSLSEPVHYACPNCFNNRLVCPLQPTGKMSGDLKCGTCDKEFRADPQRKWDPLPTIKSEWYD